ncbi:putative membrane protein, partial [Chlamydia psittaci 84-8471/1]
MRILPPSFYLCISGSFSSIYNKIYLFIILIIKY